MKIKRVRKHGRVRWMVDYGVRNGRRRRAFFREEKEARAAVRMDAREVEAVGVQAWSRLTARERGEVIEVLSEIRSAGLTLRGVWRVYQDQAAKLKVSQVALGDAVAACIEAKRAAQLRPRYVEGLRAYLEAFVRGREKVQIDQIGPADIEAWFDERGEVPGTKASNLGRLSALFSFARRRGWVVENPCERVERVRLDERPPVIFNVDQVRRALGFVRASLPGFLPWFVLAVFAGIRPEELDKLDCAAVDLNQGTVTIDAAASKVRRRRIVHLQPVARAWLGQGGFLPLPVTTRRRALRLLRDYLGLKAWPQDVLRHTAASFLLAMWQDAGRVANELGNSPGILLRHYRELVTKEAAAKFWALLPESVS